MNISIQVAINSTIDPIDCVDNVDVYRFGTQFSLSASFINEGESAITVDNPQTSQLSLLLLQRIEDQEEETFFELNPAFIDLTGEITAPESSDIELPTRQSITLNIDLSDRFKQSSFLPGSYEVAVQYLNSTSNVIQYKVSYDDEAKKQLLYIAIDEQADIDLRSLAADFLMSQNDTDSIEIMLPVKDESAEERAKRINENEQAVKQSLER